MKMFTCVMALRSLLLWLFESYAQECTDMHNVRSFLSFSQLKHELRGPWGLSRRLSVSTPASVALQFSPAARHRFASGQGSIVLSSTHQQVDYR